MKVTVSFEDRDYTYEIDLDVLLKALGVDKSEDEIRAAINKVLITQ